MTESYSERQIRASERILEDESLTEDLSDGPAQALITWASQEAARLAGNESRSDEELSSDLKALRKAVRTAASSGEYDAEVLIAQAKKSLTAALGNIAQTAPQAQPSAQQAAPAESVAQAAPQAPEAPQEPAKHHAKEGKAVAGGVAAAAPVAQVSKPLDAKTASAETPASEQAASEAPIAEETLAQQTATDQIANEAPVAAASPAQPTKATPAPKAPSQTEAQSAGKIDPASIQAQSEAALEALMKRSSTAETTKASSSEGDTASASASQHEASSSEPNPNDKQPGVIGRYRRWLRKIMNDGRD